jgi:hypothetical protein
LRESQCGLDKGGSLQHDGIERPTAFSHETGLLEEKTINVFDHHFEAQILLDETEFQLGKILPTAGVDVDLLSAARQFRT